MKPVRNINIQNQEFLDILNEYKDTLLHRDKPGDEPFIAKKIKIRGRGPAEDWISDEYMNHIMHKGERHTGFPDMMVSHQGLKFEEGSGSGSDGPEIKEASSKLHKKLLAFLSASNNALTACYPPGGFISWHNNANAYGYNIIITYSETGEGWFDYWDIDKKERVRIHDKPGWQAKMTYFGSYDEPENICYHAAYTDCYRITVAFMFKEADNFWEEVIEDLETPS